MAFDTYAGTFSSSSTTGNQSVTGVGFIPKVIIFFGGYLATDTTASYYARFTGIGISSTSRAVVSSSSEGNAATTASWRRTDNNSCIHVVAVASGANLAEADLVSMDADGFTVNWTTVTSARKYNYIALGGDDLTNVDLTQFTTPTTVTASHAVTGVGFQPDCVMMITESQSSLNTTQSYSLSSIGYGLSSTNRYAISNTTEHGVSTSNTKRAQLADKIIYTMNTNTGAAFLSADLVSLDSDGFTLDFDTVNATARTAFALSLKGGQYKLGVETQKTSTGTKATTGAGFQPTGLILNGVCNTSSASVADNNRYSFGVVSGTTERAYLANADEDNKGTTEADTKQNSAKAIGFITGGTPTLDAEADLSSFDSDGYTLNWTTADATAREFVYLAFGSDATGGIPINLAGNGGLVGQGGLVGIGGGLVR